jgi:hypothetical protein
MGLRRLTKQVCGASVCDVRGSLEAEICHHRSLSMRPSHCHAVNHDVGVHRSIVLDEEDSLVQARSTFSFTQVRNITPNLRLGHSQRTAHLLCVSRVYPLVLFV